MEFIYISFNANRIESQPRNASKKKYRMSKILKKYTKSCVYTDRQNYVPQCFRTKPKDIFRGISLFSNISKCYDVSPSRFRENSIYLKKSKNIHFSDHFPRMQFSFVKSRSVLYNDECKTSKCKYFLLFGPCFHLKHTYEVYLIFIMYKYTDTKEIAL